MKKYSFLILITFVLIPISLNIASAEKTNLSTYYTSTSGEYEQLRLFPKNFDTSLACNIGTMRVDENSHLWLCTDDGFGTGTWGDASSAGVWEQNGNNLYPMDTDTANPHILMVMAALLLEGLLGSVKLFQLQGLVLV